MLPARAWAPTGASIIQYTVQRSKTAAWSAVYPHVARANRGPTQIGCRTPVASKCAACFDAAHSQYHPIRVSRAPFLERGPFRNEELLDARLEKITGSRRRSRRVHPRRAQSFMPLSPQEKRERRAAQRNADAHAHDTARGQRQPRGREPAGCYWDPRPGEATGTWRKLHTHEAVDIAAARRARDTAHGNDETTRGARAAHTQRPSHGRTRSTATCAPTAARCSFRPMRTKVHQPARHQVARRDVLQPRRRRAAARRA